MTNAQPAGAFLDVEGLRIESSLGGRPRTIVSGVGFSLCPGESLGIVGESGSGKSMTARAIVRLLPDGVRVTGAVVHRGRNLLALSQRELARVRGREIALMFQDPFTMLNPLLRCGAHIEETLREAGGRKLEPEERRTEALRRLAEVEIDDPRVFDRYPFQLSGGMRQRVALAAALAQNPDLLIADEPTTALDVTTQREILALLSSLGHARKMALVLITHDLRVAFSVCDRILVLYAGSLLELAPARDIEREPLHPYTQGLLLAEPPSDRRVGRLVAIPGTVPAPDDVAAACSFAARCEWAAQVCTAGRPPLRALASGRLTACVRIEEIRSELQEARVRGSAEEPAPPRGPGPAPLVVIESLEKSFPARRSGGEVTALAGVSIEVGKDESVGLVGESGSGKTTLARCLLGLETPTGGRIEIAGVDVTDYGRLGAEERRRVRRTVQIIFQDPYSSLNPVRSVGATLREAICVASTGRHRRLDEEIAHLLERVGLPRSYAARKPTALSGGERQRVAIARALAVGPELIVCDEPVSALDVSVQAQILNLFASLREELGLSYLFITHDLAVVRQVVDRLYVLYRGEIVEAGRPDDVLDRPKHPYTARLVDSVPRSDPDWLAGAAEAGVA